MTGEQDDTGPIRAIAARYLELINRGGDASMAELYAVDAELFAPQRQHFRGHEAIAEFYRWDLVQADRRMRMGRFICERDNCAFELEVALGDGEFRTQGMVRMTLGSNDRLIRQAVYLCAPPHAGIYDASAALTDS